MIKLGEVNNLLVNRGSAMGFFLIDTSGEEVFLPFKYAPDNLQLKDVIDVFVYNDSEDNDEDQYNDELTLERDMTAALLA